MSVGKSRKKKRITLLTRSFDSDAQPAVKTFAQVAVGVHARTWRFVTDCPTLRVAGVS